MIFIMKRLIINELIQWKNRKYRKSLILKLCPLSTMVE